MEVIKKIDKIYALNKLKESINLVIGSSHLLEQVVMRSVEHHNGFLKIVVEERGIDKCGVRIHEWKPGYFDSNIHSHRWNMATLILSGGYRASYYEKSIKGEPYLEYDFKPNKDFSYGLFLQNEVKLMKKKNVEYKKGEFYSMLNSELHRIESVGNLGALTAMLSWGEESAVAQVFSKSNEFPAELQQRRLDQREVTNCLERVLTILEFNKKDILA